MVKSTISTALMLMLASAVSANSQEQTAPADAEPLSSAELTELYSDRTWVWEDGAAYFAPDGDFKAVTGGEEEPTRATGSWETRSDGRVCFRGVWRSSEETKDLTHCFRHVRADGTVYQRQEPGRPWTVFMSSDEEVADAEYSRFRQGDVVSEESDLVSAD